MALYFYSLDDNGGRIRAVTGVKGLLFSDSEVAREFEAFWAAKDGDLTFSPNDAYAEAAKRLAGNCAFREELDHFAIVEKAGVARALFVWNVVCRMAYSVGFRRPDTLFGGKVLPIHREIVRYHQAYGAYFLVGSPILEESYVRRWPGETKDHSHFYAPNREAAAAFLDAQPALPDHASLAASLDDAFLRMWRDRHGAHQPLSYRDVRRPIGFVRMALELAIYRPVLTSMPAAGLVVRRFVELLWRMGGPLLRLLTSGRNNQSVAGLASVSAPAVLSPRGHIDPVGFVANRAQWGSLERPCECCRTVWLGNLLWHVLSRSAEVATQLKAGVSKSDIEAHCVGQWEFYGDGFIKDADVRDMAADVDRTIIDHIFQNCPDGRSLGDTRHITAMGLKVFHDVVENDFSSYEAKGRLESFAEAFGITYMQV